MISTLDLARLCGVSQGMVDRALHDRPGIGKKTRARILAAVRKHGYQPHPAARELLTGDLSVLGVDNSPAFVELCPGITTLAYPTAEIAGAIRSLLATRRRTFSIPSCAVVERSTVAKATGV